MLKNRQQAVEFFDLAWIVLKSIFNMSIVLVYMVFDLSQCNLYLYEDNHTTMWQYISQPYDPKMALWVTLNRV